MEEPAGVWFDPCRQIHLKVRLFYGPAHGVMKRGRDHNRCRHCSLDLETAERYYGGGGRRGVIRTRETREGWPHKVHIYLVYKSVFPSLELGPPTPYPASEFASTLNHTGKEGGTHSPACEVVGESQFGRLERKLNTLSSLWVAPTDC